MRGGCPARRNDRTLSDLPSDEVRSMVIRVPKEVSVCIYVAFTITGNLCSAVLLFRGKEFARICQG